MKNYLENRGGYRDEEVLEINGERFFVETGVSMGGYIYCHLRNVSSDNSDSAQYSLTGRNRPFTTMSRVFSYAFDKWKSQKPKGFSLTISDLGKGGDYSDRKKAFNQRSLLIERSMKSAFGERIKKIDENTYEFI